MSLVWAVLLLGGYCIFVGAGFARARHIFRARKTGEIKTGIFGGRTVYRSQEPGQFRWQVIKGAVFSAFLLLPLVIFGNLVLRTVLGAIARL